MFLGCGSSSTSWGPCTSADPPLFSLWVREGPTTSLGATSLPVLKGVGHWWDVGPPVATTVQCPGRPQLLRGGGGRLPGFWSGVGLGFPESMRPRPPPVLLPTHDLSKTQVTIRKIFVVFNFHKWGSTFNIKTPRLRLYCSLNILYDVSGSQTRPDPALSPTLVCHGPRRSSRRRRATSGSCRRLPVEGSRVGSTGCSSRRRRPASGSCIRLPAEGVQSRVHWICA